jgi:hypothetical protein
VLEALERLWPDYTYAGAALERRFGWPAGTLQRLARVVAVLHDVGKLGRGWQGWVRKYHQAIGQPIQSVACAHTEYDPLNLSHKKASRAAGARPPHAAEGGLAGLQILAMTAAQDLDLTCAAYSAIARHHAPHSHDWHTFRLATDDPRHFMSENARRVLDSLEGWAWMPSVDRESYADDTDGYLADPARDKRFHPTCFCADLRRDQQATYC